MQSFTRSFVQRPWPVILSLVLGGLLILAACAPEDADFTPTARPATPTPTPTPTPEGQVEEADPKEDQIELIRAALPRPISANGLNWGINESEGQNGYSVPPNIGNGVGLRAFYRATGANGNFELTFVVFDTPQEARNHYDFMVNEVRASQISPGRALERLPSPNIVGGGPDRGSAALMIVEDIVFVDVLIENFDSTMGDPRNAVAEVAAEVVQEAVLRYNTPNFTEEKIAVLEEAIPSEINLLGETWFRAGIPIAIRDVPFGGGWQARYRNELRDELALNFLVFDLPSDADTYFEDRRRGQLTFDLDLSYQTATTNDQFEFPNRLTIGTLDGGAAIFNLENGHFIEIQARTFSGEFDIESLIDTAAEEALRIMNEVLADFEDGPALETEDQSDASPSDQDTISEEATPTEGVFG